MGALRLCFLGAPQVRHGGSTLSFPTRKVLALLVYLTVEGGVHSRERLAALFWPESAPEQARAALRYTLASLRTALSQAGPASYLIIQRDRLGFEPGEDIDVDLRVLDTAYNLARSSSATIEPGERGEGTLIAQLQQASDAWRGEFLEGLSLRDALEFDDWVTFQRETWHQRIELIHERLCQLRSDRGDTRSAIETATRWLSLAPLNEEAHRRLIQLQLAAGDRPAALRAYEACRDVLARELGVEPAPETQALIERIRLSSPAPPTSRPPPRDHPPIDSPLVGRAGEFFGLVTSYHTARAGSPQVVVLRGEAGIGKTRLASEFCAWASAQGADVIQGEPSRPVAACRISRSSTRCARGWHTSTLRTIC